MNNMIRFELRKLFRQKSLYICLGIQIGLQILTGVVIYEVLKEFGGEMSFAGGFLGIKGLVDGQAMLRMAFSSSSLMTLIVIVLSLYLTMDDASGMVKNVFGRGFTRTGNYFAKYLVSLLAVLILIGVTCLVSFVMGCLIGGPGSGYDMDFWGSLLLQLFCLFSRATLAFMFITWIGKNGPAIAVCIAAPLVISLVLSLIDLLPDMTFRLSPYWITNVQTEVMGSLPSGSTLERILLTCLIYWVGSLMLGWWIASRKEV